MQTEQPAWGRGGRSEQPVGSRMEDEKKKEYGRWDPGPPEHVHAP
jgi:hypothetical protein